MSGADLFAFNAVLIAAIASPGAAFLFAVRTTVAHGRGAGLAAGIGLGTMATLWTLAALLGLESVFLLFPWAYGALKLLGAAYLIWIAVQTWRAARAPLAAAETHTPARRHLLSGLLINLGNPKSMLFAASVIVVIFPKALAPEEMALIALNHLLLEWLFYGGIALLLGAPAARARYLRLKPLLDRIAAGLLGALGLRLLLERS